MPNVGFSIDGNNFDAIPYDAIGLFADDNEAPLAFIESTSDTHLYDIVSKTTTHIELVSLSPTELHTANYLGAIVSRDRQTIYWTNTTKPLP